MQVKWSKMAAKFTVWVVAEVLLNLVGLDNLADYSEFIDGTYTAQLDAAQVVLIASVSNS